MIHIDNVWRPGSTTRGLYCIRESFPNCGRYAGGDGQNDKH